MATQTRRTGKPAPENQIAPRRRKSGRNSSTRAAADTPVLFRLPDVSSAMEAIKKLEHDLMTSGPVSSAEPTLGSIANSDSTVFQEATKPSAVGMPARMTESAPTASSAASPAVVVPPAPTILPSTSATTIAKPAAPISNGDAMESSEGADHENARREMRSGGSRRESTRQRRSVPAPRPASPDGFWTNLKNIALLLAAPLLLYAAIRFFSGSKEDVDRAPGGLAQEEENLSTRISDGEPVPLDELTSPAPIKDRGSRVVIESGSNDATTDDGPHFPMKRSPDPNDSQAPQNLAGKESADERGSDPTDVAESNENDANRLVKDETGSNPPPSFDKTSEPVADSQFGNPNQFYNGSDGNANATPPSYPDTGYPPYRFDTLARPTDSDRQVNNVKPRDGVRTSDANSSNVRLRGNINTPPIR